jgi:hypothetical protein
MNRKIYGLLNWFLIIPTQNPHTFFCVCALKYQIATIFIYSAPFFLLCHEVISSIIFLIFLNNFTLPNFAL